MDEVLETTEVPESKPRKRRVKEVLPPELEVVVPVRLDLKSSPVPKFELVSEADLDRGAGSLAKSLLEDASEMLRHDQQHENFFSPVDLTKRRQYIVNVMKEVSKRTQGRELNRIKRNADVRGTVTFLEGLFNRARAGSLGQTELVVLKGALAPEPETALTPLE